MAVMQISKPQTGNPGAEVRQPVPQSFWAAAEEAGQSRVYGGIHWQFDNTEGLATGRDLARLVSRRYLLALNSDQPSRDRGHE
jgi:hypothetical protein